MEIIIGVAAKIAQYTVGPILHPIARPFKTLWEYKSNLEKLKNEVKKLEAKSGDVQRLTNVGVEPPRAVRDWQGKVTEISNEVWGLDSQHNPQQQSMRCCQRFTCSNLKKCYRQRTNVARMLDIVAQLYQEATESENLWEYKSNLENLKKEMENLKAARERVRHLIKDGEEALPHVEDWQGTINNMINEITGLINISQQQNMPCCKQLICRECYERRDRVAMKLNDVADLLQKASSFGEVSTITEETAYKNNFEDLKKEVETLKIKKESVQRLIKVGEEPLPDVKAWQDEVKKIIDEVSGLTSEHNPEQQNNVALMLEEVAQLLREQEKFKEVSYQPKPELTCLQPSIQQEASESRMSILKDIIAALRNTDVNLVGIYGMGGVGKTTLANKVRYQAVQDKLFDKVLFVEVSQSPEIRTIQGVIADGLGLKFEEETVQGRAGKLWDVLKKEEKILIILDNLWMGIKLEKIGIPFGNACKGLKLLLTARSHDVLTKEMDSQHNFYVEALSAAEAWSLFKNIAGTCIDHPHFKYIAEEVVKKCGRMPIAIVAVAKALKGTQSQDEWKDALRRLNNPSSESFEGITKEVFTSIKWSYDCLPKDLREIFLLCSRMGCTYDASVQDLFRYGLGLGLFDKFDTIEEALCHVHASINKLKAASLLLDAPEAFFDDTSAYERFAIHDVIYDVARSIASEGRHIFTVRDDHVPRSLTNENTLKRCTSITLYNTGELPRDLALECPNLKFLYVKPKNLYLTIPDNFFRGMPNLQVLHLIRIDLSLLPTTLSCLVNLQALFLNNCKLKDMVVVGDMKKLEVLSFRGSDIKKLPKEMQKLTKLRLLDLSDCWELRVIPSIVLSSLTGIEALYMLNTYIQWEVAGPNIERSNVSIDELKHLHRLTLLEMRIQDVKMFRGLISSELKRYKIFIGVAEEFLKNYKTSRTLKLRLDSKVDWIFSQLQGVEELELEGEVVGAISLLDDLDRNGFPQLMYLDVSRNNHAVYIVNPASCAVLPSLESLMVQYMESLKKICNSPLGAESFLNLKTIHVGNCNKLSNIFCFSSLVRVLPNLIDLKVDTCENMEEIFAIEEQDDGNSIEMLVRDIQFSQLSYLRLINLPKLGSFCCKAKTASPSQSTGDTLASEIFSREELNNPSSLFNEKFMGSLKKICNSPLGAGSFLNLKTIHVGNCNKLSNIVCCSSIVRVLPNLIDLKVDTCKNIEEIFAIEEQDDGNSTEVLVHDIQFSQLSCLLNNQHWRL